MRRLPSRTLHTLTLTVALVGALAGSAAATPFPITFNGQGAAQNFGISAASASAAQAAGIPILQTTVFDVTGVLDVVHQSLSAVHLSQTPNTPFQTDSTWTVESVFGSHLDANMYLVFTTTDPGTVMLPGGNQNFEYQDSLVGLVLDATKGWALLQTSDPQLGTIFYPAISLGALDPGQQKDVDLRYHLEQLITFPNGNDKILALPKLRIAVAQVIPEPSTALLFAFGLLGLAARSRARS